MIDSCFVNGVCRPECKVAVDLRCIQARMVEFYPRKLGIRNRWSSLETLGDFCRCYFCGCNHR